MPGFTIYAVPLFLAAFISYLLGFYSWRLRQFKGIVPFCLVILLCGTWALVAGLDTLTGDLELKIFYLQVRISVAALAPTCWLAMTSILVGKQHIIKGYWLALLLLLPLVILGLVWTMGQHTLLRYSFEINNSGPFPVLLFKNGPWFYVHVIYGYLVQATSVAFLIHALRDTRNLYYRQAITMLLCVFLPAVPDFLFNLNISPVRGFNFTPATFSIAGILMAWALFRYQLFDLAPIARSTVIETVQDLMLVFDPHNRLVDYNQAAQNSFKPEVVLAIGLPMGQVFKASPDLQQKSQEETIERAEIRLDDSGRPQFYELVVTPLKSNQARPLGRLFLLRNITDQKQVAAELSLAHEQLQARLVEIELLQSKLRDDAIRDRLTGLYNRRYLDETLHREIAGVARTGGYLSLVMIDIDHFKNINDTFGHKTGDIMIQALSALLQDQTRVSDIACRYGGEEFVLVMPEISIERAYERVEQLRITFEALQVNLGDATLRSTFSAGIAVYPEHAVTGEELMHLADQALYQAKTGGRNCVKIYESQTPFRFEPYENAGELLGQAEYKFFNSDQANSPAIKA